MLWRGGCIIRAVFLDRIKEAFDADPKLENLLLAPYFTKALASAQDAWRNVVATAAKLGIPVPAFAAALAYYDGYRRERLPANLLQAQRDYFGAHTYERIDKPGTFHTDWIRERTSKVGAASRAANVQRALVRLGSADLPYSCPTTCKTCSASMATWPSSSAAPACWAASFASGLAQAGATVVVAGRNAERGQDRVAKIENLGGKATFVEVDASNRESVKALLDTIIAQHGRVDALRELRRRQFADTVLRHHRRRVRQDRENKLIRHAPRLPDLRQTHDRRAAAARFSTSAA